MAAPGFGAKNFWTSVELAGRRGRSGAVFRRVVFFLAAGFASPDDDRGRALLERDDDRARGFGATGASVEGGGERAAPRRVARQSMSWRSTSALTSGGSSLSVSKSTSAPSMPASTGGGAGGSGAGGGAAGAAGGSRAGGGAAGAARAKAASIVCCAGGNAAATRSRSQASKFSEGPTSASISEPKGGTDTRDGHTSSDNETQRGTTPFPGNPFQTRAW